MGTGRWHGRPGDSAAGAAEASARLVESVRSGDAAAFEAAVALWCDSILAEDVGWALWLWRGQAGFALGGRGGRALPPQAALDAVAQALQTDEVRTQLATGRPTVLDPAAGGPDAVVAAVAFGSPAGLLAVLAAFKNTGQGTVGDAELGALDSAARLCTAALAPSASAPTRADFHPGLLADLRDALTAVVGFAHTLIRSEHRLGRVERRHYHAVIEREALALTGTVDDAAIVAGPLAGAAHPRELAPADRAAFAEELVARLGPDADVSVGSDVAAALPAVVDWRALAHALAGLAVAVGAPGGAHVEVAAATSAAVARVGVTAAVGDEIAASIADLVRAARAGAADVVWSGRAALAVAAAAAVAAAHGGDLGCEAVDGDVLVWLDLPLATTAP